MKEREITDGVRLIRGYISLTSKRFITREPRVLTYPLSYLSTNTRVSQDPRCLLKSSYSQRRN
uniref:Uncharacterized protein n=1 Tax=Anguilla anguilla TaxID=7936 RepID=A0A0E9V8S6_ANGAN